MKISKIFKYILLHFVCRIRVPYPFQWGRPTVDAGDTFAMMAACFVAVVEVNFFKSISSCITSMNAQYSKRVALVQLPTLWRSGKGLHCM